MTEPEPEAPGVMNRPATVYVPLPPDHDCHEHLPSRPGGYGSTGVPRDTVAVCPCGRWWVSLPCYEHYGPTSRWYRVRWWRFRAARQVRALTEAHEARALDSFPIAKPHVSRPGQDNDYDD